jgi:hypothetical protein
LLDRLNIPKRPLVHDQLQKEEDEDVTVPPKKETAEAGESGENGEDEEEKEKAETVH